MNARRILLALGTLVIFIAAMIAMWPDARRAFAQIFVPAGCYNVTSTSNGATYNSCVTPTPAPTASPTASPVPTPSPTPSPTASPSPTPSPSPTAPATPLALVTTSSVVTPGPVLSMMPVVSATPAANLLGLSCPLVDSGSTLATPAGWTLLMSSVQTGAITQYVFYRWTVATSEPTSVTFVANNSDYMSSAVRYYRGVNQIQPFSNVGIVNVAATALNAPSLTLTPWVAGTMPVACFAANSAMGATSHTSGWTEDYTAFPSAQNGNGFLSPYNANEGQTGPAQTGATPSPATASVAWNITAGNGPVGQASLLFLAPSSGAVSPVALGFVSTITGTGFTANCGLVNFGQFGCYTVTTTGATTTGTLAVGQFYRAYGSFSQVPTVIATHVDYSASPYPNSPTPVPTAAPTTTPSPGPSPSIVPGAEFAVGFVPFLSTAPWNTPVQANCESTSDCVATYSTTLINNTWSGGNSCPTAYGYECVVQVGGDDHDVYVCTSAMVTSGACVQITINCTSYCGTGVEAATSAYIPKIAIPASGCTAPGGDSPIQLIQPNLQVVELGYVYSCGAGWTSGQTQGDWISGQTVNAGAAATCGNIQTGALGFLTTNVGASASGRCFVTGEIRANEIVAGVVSHALSVTPTCLGQPGGSTWQYPALPGSSAGSADCTNGVMYGMPLGGHWWWDETAAVTCAAFTGGCDATETYLINTLHTYGYYVTDDIGGASNAGGFGEFTGSNNYEFTTYGNPSPFASLTDWPSHYNPSNGGVTLYQLSVHQDSEYQWNPWLGHWNTGDAADPKIHLKALNACAATASC